MDVTVRFTWPRDAGRTDHVDLHAHGNPVVVLVEGTRDLEEVGHPNPAASGFRTPARAPMARDALQAPASEARLAGQRTCGAAR
jgi:hypothetical protein